MTYIVMDTYILYTTIVSQDNVFKGFHLFIWCFQIFSAKINVFVFKGFHLFIWCFQFFSAKINVFLSFCFYSPNFAYCFFIGYKIDDKSCSFFLKN